MSYPSKTPITPKLSVNEDADKYEWLPDEASDKCMACTTKFSLATRRHHCRNCGKLVCGKCSRHKWTLGETQRDVRVCDWCYGQLEEAQRDHDNDGVSNHFATAETFQNSLMSIAMLVEPPKGFVDFATVNECAHCKEKMRGLLNEKHHCYACGGCFCGRCLGKFNLPESFLRDKKIAGAQRVCYACEWRIKQKNMEKKGSYDATQDPMVIQIPKWESSSRYVKCFKCMKKGGKGENCYACGRLFCDTCTSKRLVPDAFKKRIRPGAVPVCDRCRFWVLVGATYVVKGPRPKLIDDKGNEEKLAKMLAAKDGSSENKLGSDNKVPAVFTRFLAKVKSEACAGCSTSFSFFNRRMVCGHCPAGTFWCKKCLSDHLSDLKEASVKGEPLMAQSSSSPSTSSSSNNSSSSATTVSISVASSSASHHVSSAFSGSSAAQRAPPPNPPPTLQQAEEALRKQRAARAATTTKAGGVEEKRSRSELFEILGRLGEGSYGAVYKAKDLRDGKLVAIKVLEVKEDNHSDLDREIDFLTDCDSDYIVRFKGQFEEGNNIWIVMEYCEAGALSDLMEICERTLTEEQIAVAMRESLYGLKYLHESKKIHRDVKAGNLLVNSLGECKLADFGVSCTLKSAAERRKTVIGTPYWMAPEILQNKPYDSKCDIWSLAITALELAKGVPPLSDLHPMRALFKIPVLPAPQLPDPENWSADFVDFLRVSLCKNPEKRPSAKELLSNHPFITKAKSISVLADLVKTCMADIEAFRNQEVQEAQAAKEKQDKAIQDDGGVAKSNGPTTAAAPSVVSHSPSRVNVDNLGYETMAFPSGTMIDFHDTYNPERGDHGELIGMSEDPSASQKGGAGAAPAGKTNVDYGASVPASYVPLGGYAGGDGTGEFTTQNGTIVSRHPKTVGEDSIEL